MVDIWVERSSEDFRNNKLKVVMEFTEEERMRSVPNVQDFISTLLMLPEKKQEEPEYLTPFGDREANLLVEVITYHYRKDSASCGCGWSELGRSHAQHVVDVFKASLHYLKE